MITKITLILSFISLILTLSGCSTKQKTETVKKHYTITAKEAKSMMDENEDIIILDVRTMEEYEQGHIKGSILIPDTDINDKAEDILEDKSAVILVYCRSGRRSALAAKSLSELGYKNIYDFGGILDWEYEIVTE